jgi:hypothetical protein
MKIEIQSIKITLKWWQFAMIIAAIILTFKAPDVLFQLLQDLLSFRLNHDFFCGPDGFG